MVSSGAPPDPGQVVHLPVSGEPPFLLRIPVTSATWAESLPPTPAGLRVTVSFSDAEVMAEHEDAVALLGYEPVGVMGGNNGVGACVDLLIPRTAVDRWPVWRDALLGSGGRVWDLGLGPVAHMMAPALAVHR